MSKQIWSEDEAGQIELKASATKWSFSPILYPLTVRQGKERTPMSLQQTASDGYSQVQNQWHNTMK